MQPLRSFIKHAQSELHNVTSRLVTQSITGRRFTVLSSEKNQPDEVAKRFLHTLNYDKLASQMPEDSLIKLGIFVIDAEEKLAQAALGDKVQIAAAKRKVKEDIQEIAILTNNEIERQGKVFVAEAKVLQALQKFTSVSDANEDEKKVVAFDALTALTELASLKGIDLAKLSQSRETLVANPSAFAEQAVKHLFAELGTYVQDPKVVGRSLANYIGGLIKVACGILVTWTLHEMYEKDNVAAVKEVQKMKNDCAKVYEHDRDIYRENLQSSHQIELQLSGDSRAHVDGIRAHYRKAGDQLMSEWKSNLDEIDIIKVRGYNKQSLLDQQNEINKRYYVAIQNLTQDFTSQMKVFTLKIDVENQIRKLDPSARTHPALASIKKELLGIDLMDSNKDALMIQLKSLSDRIIDIESQVATLQNAANRRRRRVEE